MDTKQPNPCRLNAVQAKPHLKVVGFGAGQSYLFSFYARQLFREN